MHSGCDGDGFSGSGAAAAGCAVGRVRASSFSDGPGRIDVLKVDGSFALLVHWPASGIFLTSGLGGCGASVGIEDLVSGPRTDVSRGVVINSAFSPFGNMMDKLELLSFLPSVSAVPNWWRVLHDRSPRCWISSSISPSLALQ